MATPLPSDSPEVHQARGRGLGTGEEESPRRPRILGQPCLGRCAGIPAVAPVVEEQDTVAALAQRRGQGRAEPAMPGVAVEDEDGGAGARLERRHQPAVQPEAVGRGKHHGFGGIEPEESGSGHVARGEVDQATLEHPQRPDQQIASTAPVVNAPIGRLTAFE